MNKIKAAIIGSTGYVGEELARILANHDNVELKYLTSKSYTGQQYSDVYQNFNHISNMECSQSDIETIAQDVDVIFIALPHGIAAQTVTSEILKKTKVIDLGADFRIKDKNVYEKWYACEHKGEEVLREAVYGLSEIYRGEIKNARLVANPGCYTTCSILSLYPLLKEDLINKDSIIIDAKSGVTGAGRELSLGVHYCEVNESTKAYKIASHRHTPEIEQELSAALNKEVIVQFTPHLIPMSRGILATCYAKIKDGIDLRKVKQAYCKYYENEYFIRLLKDEVCPETKWVKGSNFLDIALFYDERTNNLIVTGAIDNLLKGAAGQAVQNMNIMFGFDEKEGLKSVPIFP